jgi:hypothetical protein
MNCLQARQQRRDRPVPRRTDTGKSYFLAKYVPYPIHKERKLLVARKDAAIPARGPRFAEPATSERYSGAMVMHWPTLTPGRSHTITSIGIMALTTTSAPPTRLIVPAILMGYFRPSHC